MRQRRIKDLDEKLDALGYLLADDPEGMRGRWREAFVRGRGDDAARGDLAEFKNESGCEGDAWHQSETGAGREGLFLEIGCGKGTFITAMAESEPKSLFIGAEGNRSVILRSLEKTAEGQFGNVLFIADYISRLTDIFADGELDGIFLNFSDPWPKARHAKRRLTHPSYLAEYSRVLNGGGFVRFKTDNSVLFEWSLEQAEKNADALGFDIAAVTRDLEHSPYFAGSPASEYEEKFSGAGININYFELIKKGH